LLPIEILCYMATFLRKIDAKRLSITCKFLREVTKERIWTAPIFRRKVKMIIGDDSHPSLSMLHHLPIVEVRTSDLEVSWKSELTIDEIIEGWRLVMTELGAKILHIDDFNEEKDIGLDINRFIPLKELKIILYTHVWRYDIDKDLLEFIDFLKEFKTFEGFKGLIIKQYDRSDHNEAPRCLTAHEIKLLMAFPVIEIHLSSLNLHSTPFDEFVTVLGQFSDSCVLNMGIYNPFDAGVYNLSVSDLQKMVVNKIRVPQLNIDWLNTDWLDDLSEDLNQFVPALQNMSLQELVFCDPSLNTFPKMVSDLSYLEHLPIKHLSLEYLIDGMEHFDKMIAILSSMKELESIAIKCRWDLYKMSPADLMKFIHLPVKTIDLGALDVTEANVEEFYNVVSRMNIEEIEIVDNTGVGLDQEFPLRAKEFFNSKLSFKC